MEMLCTLVYLNAIGLVYAMGRFLIAVRRAKGVIPKKALFAFNFCADALVRAELEDVLALSFVKRDAKLKKDVRAGVQREVFIGKKDYLMLKRLFPHAKMRVGGQAGFGALTAEALGVKASVLNAHKTHFPSLKNIPVHFVFEHKTHFGKASRLIAAYQRGSIVPKKVPAKMCGFSHIFIGGFHLLKSSGEVQRAAKFVSEMKRNNPHAKIFVEAGEFQGKLCIPAFKKSMLPLVDFLGVNEVELRQLAGGEGISAARKLDVEKIIFHSPRGSFAYPAGKSDAIALLFAKLVASYAAKHGKRPSMQELEKYAVEARSLHVKKPKYTVGLGDTFSCAYFLCA